MSSPSKYVPAFATTQGADVSPSRHMEIVYGVAWLAGTVLPLSQFLPWLAEHGLDVRLFVAELFANRISAFFAWDVIVAVVVLFVLMVADRELPARQRLGVAAASLLGASCGLPLYLLLRERRRRRPA